MNAFPYTPLYPYYPTGTGQPMNYFNAVPVAQQGPHREIDRVNGKDSAYAFPMGPNSSAILADATQPKIWLVTTDSSGFKAVKGFIITPEEEEAPVVQTTGDQLAAIEERLTKLEERMNRNGQSAVKSGSTGKPDGAAVPANVRNGKDREGYDGGAQSDGRQ